MNTSSVNIDYSKATKMERELLSIKWNDHRNTFFEVLATAREKKTLCDATIACEGNMYPVHRFILSTCSTYFERILENIKDTHPVIVLAGINPKDIEDLLQYMYTGEMNVLQEDIKRLIKAGETLKIKGIGVADTNKKCIKPKHYCNDSDEIPKKRRRSDEFVENSRQNESHKIAKNNVQKVFQDCNKNESPQRINDSSGPANQLTSEFLAIKEEIFQPNEEVLFVPGQNLKEELSDSLMDEVVLLEGSEKFDRSSHNALEQEYENLASNNFHDASTSNIIPDQNMHIEWIMQNEFPGVTKENHKIPLTGWCLV